VAVLRIAVVGAGAVGGYYGAKLALAGHDVHMLARGAHRRAMAERGLAIWSVLGDVVVHPGVAAHPADIGPVDLVLFAVKTYDNAVAIPLLAPLLASQTLVLSLQNGVSGIDDLAAHVGASRVLAGPTYIATALTMPGVIEQTGTHRRIVFGEAFGAEGQPSARVLALAEVLRAADIEAEAVADARIPLWEKFTYLAPFATVTGAARSPAGTVWGDPDLRALFRAAVHETEAVARAEGIAMAPDTVSRIEAYMEALPGSTRSSLLIDLLAGRRLELEVLAGHVVRRGAVLGVEVPAMRTLYAVLKPWAGGRPDAGLGGGAPCR
jgi:2-dehydropantoate 2-reductase